MSTFRYVFLLLYCLFHVLLLLGSLYTISKIGDSDFTFIRGFIENENTLLTSSNLINFTVFGLLLFGLNVFLIWRDSKRLKKQNDAKDREIIALKAQLFDLTPGTPATPRTPENLPAPDQEEPQSEE